MMTDSNKLFISTALTIVLSLTSIFASARVNSFHRDCLLEFQIEIEEVTNQANEGYEFCRGEPMAIAGKCHEENTARYNGGVRNAASDYDKCERSS